MPSHFRLWLIGELHPLCQKVLVVFVRSTPYEICLSPWMSYDAITKHWSMTSTTSDNANMSPIPCKRWKFSTPSHSQKRYGGARPRGLQTPLIGQVWWAQQSLWACRLHKNTDCHNWNAWLPEVQIFIWHFQGCWPSIVIGLLCAYINSY